MESKSISVEVGGKTLSFETGKVARQANGSVILRMGDTVIFTSACASKDPSDNMDFFPLRVDYQEKFSGAGKTLGGFIKREGRPSERETLVCRLIDRTIRPLFVKGYFNEVQVLSYVWSFDGVNAPEPLAICATSAALVISDIPLIKPVAGVRVGYIDGVFILNPSPVEQKVSRLDLILAGTEDAILMTEGFADFLTEDEMLEAIALGHSAIKDICKTLVKWREEVGKEKNVGALKVLPEEVYNSVKEIMAPTIDQAMRITDKKEREVALSVIKEQVSAKLLPEGEEPLFDPAFIKQAIKKVSSGQLRNIVLEEGVRCDGRKTNEIRKISIEQSFLPRTHGSSLFTRGETQTVAVCTLGGENMGQRYETIEEDSVRRFYLQYFFPPFSVGEVGRVGPPGRREVGHGKLAERSLTPVVPLREDFPYTIRLESNITESNGSSSMASVCGGCLAMMDAGVPIKRPVAGIAMGLIWENDKFVVLSDILGIEDALGDMDFKVSGDDKGITAFQMDIKVEGITPEIMEAALFQAKEGRTHILGKMLEACPKAREEMSAYAPRIETIQVKPSKIGTIIGPGGKQIRAIIEETGVDIDIEDSGLVSIAASDPEAMKKAKGIIEGLLAEVEIGKVYDGKVVSVVPFGAFVEILPGKEGLCHISELDSTRIEDVFAYIKEGDQITVKVLDINERGQVKLSRKATLVAK
ncbi:MAG: polyribonucleotide nucleotidyltransferase [Chlamydiales bacterium]|jgi:polyribonucleotide nucleotidyltransferase